MASELTKYEPKKTPDKPCPVCDRTTMSWTVPGVARARECECGWMYLEWYGGTYYRTRV